MASADFASPYGVDADVDTDLQPDGRSCSGARLVANAMLHRLMEENLPCIGAPGDVLEFGEKVRLWAGEALAPGRLAMKGARLAMVLARDPRVDAGSLVVNVDKAAPGTTFAGGGKVDLTITISARTTDALPIERVVGVSSVTVEFLSQGT